MSFFFIVMCSRFDTDDPNFFNTSIRTTVVSYILERERFGDEDQDKGIKRLIAEDVYKAAYPLHDVRREFIYFAQQKS